MRRLYFLHRLEVPPWRLLLFFTEEMIEFAGRD